MSDWWWRGVLALLLWPGLAGGALLGWLYLWMSRKLAARAQGRQGPPFYQPFFDFVKLLGKDCLVPAGVSRGVFYGLPLAAVVATICALALIRAPINPARPFAGDLIILLYLMEVPALCDVLAGYASRSPYGQVSAAREAVLLLAYNVPFLAAVVALAIQAASFDLSRVAGQPFGLGHVFAAIAFLLAVPARLKLNPFSIPNAEQEIVAGAHIEFNGPPLALFELAHGLELATLAGLFTVLFVPMPAHWLAGLVVYLAAGLVLVALVTLVAVGTARLKVRQAFRFYWSWGALAAAAAIAAAFVLR